MLYYVHFHNCVLILSFCLIYDIESLIARQRHDDKRSSVILYSHELSYGLDDVEKHEIRAQAESIGR